MISKPKHLKVRKGQTARAAAEAVANYAREEQAHGVTREGQPGYYAKADTPSRWIGEGAKALGLEGAVRRDDLIEVLQGRLPNGTNLSKRGGREADRRMGTDLTISAPKSFSILAIAGSDLRLAGLWDEAVNEAAKVIEREVIVARQGHGGTQVEQTGSMVCAAYTHQDARTVDGRADPDLHTHMLLMNATQRADGTWVARDLAFGDRNVLRMTADFAMKAHLAKRLQELGYKVRITQDGFEIEGITQAQIDAFSRRTGQVDIALESQGLTREVSTANQRDVATLGTREGKTKLSRIEHTYEVRDRVRTEGLDLDALTREARACGPIETADLTDAAIKSAARHLGERESVFGKHATRLEALRAGMGSTTLERIDAAITADGAVIDVGGNKLVTKAALVAEARILKAARAGHGVSQALMTHEAAESFISQREDSQGFQFSPGQREALALGLTSADRTFGIQGAAGVGKTTSMKPLISAMRDGGYEVVGLAPTTDATTALQGAGADDTRTMQSFLASPVPKDPATPRFIILDEAGKVSTSDMTRLQAKLEKMPGARLLLTGDYRQTPSVEAGSPFKTLIESGAIASVKIREVQRQKDPTLLSMAQSWADGDVAGALAKARAHITKVEVPFDEKARRRPNTDERRAALAAAGAQNYLARDPERRDKTLMMSGTNDVRRRVNSLVREGLKERGDIGRDEVTIRALDQKDITKERATRPDSYQPGEVVRLTEGRGRQRTTIDYRVVGVDGRHVVLANDAGEEKRWQPHKARAGSYVIFTERKMTLAVGDAIQIRANAGNKRDPAYLGNGQTGKVVALDKEGPCLRLNDGREVVLSDQGRHCLDYGWCRTVSKAQGSEKMAAILLDEASQGSSSELANVGLTRGIEDVAILTDNPDRTLKGWSSWADREQASDAARRLGDMDPARLDTLRAEIREELERKPGDIGLGHHGDLARARDARPLEIEQARLEQEMDR